jgi:hypothetical protein
MRRLLLLSLLLATGVLLLAAPTAGAWQRADYLVSFFGEQRSSWSDRQEITFSPCGGGFANSGKESVATQPLPFIVTAVPGALLPSSPLEIPLLATRDGKSESWSDGEPCGSGCEPCPPPEDPPPPDCGTRPTRMAATLLPFGSSGVLFRLDPIQRRDPFRRCPALISTRRWLGGSLRELLLTGAAPWRFTSPGPPPGGGTLVASDVDVRQRPGGMESTKTKLLADFRLASFVPDALSPADARDSSSPAMTGLAVSRAGAIRYRLSEPATTVFAIERSGRMVRGTFRHRGRRGANRLRLPRRLAGRRLRPGAYRLVAFASDGAGNLAAARRAPFRIVAAAERGRQVRRAAAFQPTASNSRGRSS